MQRLAVTLPAICGVLALLLFAAPARAQEERTSDPRALAKQRFREARAAYDEQRFAAAASLFEAADRLAPRAATRYNAAAAWENAREPARAATGYEAALAMGGLVDETRREARARLAALQKELARVQILMPPGALVTVDHVQRAPVPTTFFLRPGRYDVSAEYAGTSSTTTVRVEAGVSQEVELDLPAASRPPEAAVPPAPPATDSPAFPPATPPDTTRATLGWVGIGAGVALGVVAAVLGVQALSARDRFRESDNTDADAYREAKDLRLATNVLWGGATAVGATGLVLLLTAPTIEF